MSYESHVEPIKLGYLFDFKLPPGFPKDQLNDLTDAFDLVFRKGLAHGVIDRPVEIVFREVEGLPKGTIKAVIDAYGELVDEGCLAVFGPAITDNAVPMREAIEARFHVPAISVCGTDDWLGEWTFALPQGSMTDEPVFWAHLIAKAGYTTVGALIEKSLVVTDDDGDRYRMLETVRQYAEERLIDAGERDEARKLLAEGTDPSEQRKAKKATRVGLAAHDFAAAAHRLEGSGRRPVPGWSLLHSR